MRPPKHTALHITGACGPAEGRMGWCREATDDSAKERDHGWSAWPASAALAILRPRPGDAFSSADGINDIGVAVGETDQAVAGRPGVFIPHAAAWSSSGHIRVLSGAYGPGTPADLFEINNAGTAAGESYRTDARGNPVSDDATVWSPAGVPTDLGFLPGTNLSVAFGLSQSGDAAGLTADFDYANGVPLSQPHGFVWPGHGPLLTLGEPLRVLGNLGAVAAFSRNGTSILALDVTGRLTTWDATPGQWLARACKIIGRRDFTPEERTLFSITPETPAPAPEAARDPSPKRPARP
jgi:hypothetical protein